MLLFSNTQSCLTVCDSMDCCPPGSSVHGISQARILEWVAISFFRGSSWPRDQAHISTDSLLSHQWSEVSQSCPTLCDPMDCSLPGFSFHAIFQARVPEWIAISFSRGASRPRDRTQVSHIAGRHFTLWKGNHQRSLITTLVQNKSPLQLQNQVNVFE